MKNAFTMAEILLSLTIIGVVAAITLPSLTGNINERTWNTQRKALYARFSQAMALMPNLNGYGTLIAAVEADSEAGTSAIDAVDTAAETFITDGLAKVLKINNICDSEHLEDCGIASNITDLQGSIISNFTTSFNTLATFNTLFDSAHSIKQDVKAAAFETANGESILVYYNPNCVTDLGETSHHDTQPKMCANFVYDLNGNKGPNTFAKDIGFISAIYPTDPIIVAPMPLAAQAQPSNQFEAGQKCLAQNSDSRLPNRYELAAMFYNRTLLGITSTFCWSSSLISSGASGRAWSIAFASGTWQSFERTRANNVRCIRR